MRDAPSSRARFQCRLKSKVCRGAGSHDAWGTPDDVGTIVWWEQQCSRGCIVQTEQNQYGGPFIFRSETSANGFEDICCEGGEQQQKTRLCEVWWRDPKSKPIVKLAKGVRQTSTAKVQLPACVQSTMVTSGGVTSKRKFFSGGVTPGILSKRRKQEPMQASAGEAEEPTVLVGPVGETDAVHQKRHFHPFAACARCQWITWVGAGSVNKVLM